jgi:hypothetical protein
MKPGPPGPLVTQAGGARQPCSFQPAREIIQTMFIAVAYLMLFLRERVTWPDERLMA